MFPYRVSSGPRPAPTSPGQPGPRGPDARPRLTDVDLHTIELIFSSLLVLAVVATGAFSGLVVYKLFKGQG